MKRKNSEIYNRGRKYRTYEAKALKEALLKAKTIYNTIGIKPRIIDTFCNEPIEY